MRLASPLFFDFDFFISSNEKCAVCGASHIKQTARKRQKILLVAAACGILKWREGEGGRVGNKEKMAQRIKRIVHNVWFPARFYCECPCRELLLQFVSAVRLVAKNLFSSKTPLCIVGLRGIICSGDPKLTVLRFMHSSGIALGVLTTENQCRALAETSSK